MEKRLTRRVVTLAIAGVLAACGEPSGERAAPGDLAPAEDVAAAQPNVAPVDTPNPSTDSATPPVPSVEDLPGEWTAGIVDRDHQVTGAPVLMAFRVARNQGYDRTVFEFDGDAIPSYHIEYIDSPVRQCGSGQAVQIRGDGWLSIRMEPAMAHTEAGRPTIEQRQGEPNLPVILEHRLICDFEGQVEWVLGVSAPNRYRVTELADPARLVVDIRH